MTRETGIAPKLSAQDKAERTAQAAATIMNEERRASDAKVARLRALRLAGEAGQMAAPEAPKPPAARAVKRPTAASVRKLRLQTEATPAKRKAR